MSDKAFEYKLGRWFEDPEYVETITLKEDTNLKTLNTQILLLIMDYADLSTDETKLRIKNT